MKLALYNCTECSFKCSYILPPRSFEFNVTIIAPIQTMTNTCANSGPPSFFMSGSLDTLVPCSIVAINVHKINGPHKSPAKWFNKCQISFFCHVILLTFFQKCCFFFWIQNMIKFNTDCPQIAQLLSHENRTKLSEQEYSIW